MLRSRLAIFCLIQPYTKMIQPLKNSEYVVRNILVPGIQIDTSSKKKKGLNGFGHDPFAEKQILILLFLEQRQDLLELKAGKN